MRSFRVVVPPPLFDDGFRLFGGGEDLPVEQFIPEPCVQTLAIAVFLGGPRLNVSRPGSSGYSQFVRVCSGVLPFGASTASS